MNKRTLLIFVAWGLCFGTALAVIAQRRELARLQAQQEQVTEPATDRTHSEIDDNKGSVSPGTLNDLDSRELLRLRSEVTRLNARKHELAEVAETHQRLSNQLES